MPIERTDMQGTLFDIEEFTDPEVRRIMQGHTCRICAHRVSFRNAKGAYYCDAHKSRRTKTGFLRVRADQPACILFTNKDC